MTRLENLKKNLEEAMNDPDKEGNRLYIEDLKEHIAILESRPFLNIEIGRGFELTES